MCWLPIGYVWIRYTAPPEVVSVLVYSGILCSVGILGVEFVGEMYVFAILNVCLVMTTGTVCNSNVHVVLRHLSYSVRRDI